MKQGSILAGLCALGLALGIAGGPDAHAFPDKPVKIIVPAKAGGGSDYLARLFARELEAPLGQPVVVVNVPGGGQVIGNRQAADAPADGYTMTVTHAAMIIANALGTADFGPEAFAPVAQVASQNLMLAVKPESPHRDLPAFLAAAQAAPDTIRFGVNIGGVNHFAPLLLADAADVSFRYVQTGGSGGTIAAILGGHVEAGALSTGSVKSYVEAGDMRVLAALAPERDAFLPDTPTATELGTPSSFGANTWFLMPAGTPPDRVARIAGAMADILSRPDIRDDYRAKGIHPTFLSGDALAAEIDRTRERIFAAVVKHGLRKQ